MQFSDLPAGSRFIAHLVGPVLYYTAAVEGRLYRSQVNFTGEWPGDAWWELEVISLSDGPIGRLVNAQVVNEDAGYQFERLMSQGPWLEPVGIQHLNLNRERFRAQSRWSNPDWETSSAGVKEVHGTLPWHELTYGAQQVSGSLPDRTWGPIAFCIAHELIRPEMRVLAPLFAKVLGRKTARIHLRVQVLRGAVSQVVEASSEDLAQLTADLLQELEWQAFKKAQRRHVEQGEAEVFTGPEFLKAEGQLPDAQLSANDVLNRLLADEAGPHEAELRYLAQHHLPTKMNLRFVVRPYVAFLFLLEGEHTYWFVFETFKQKLATYLWPCPKSKAAAQRLFTEEIQEAIQVISAQRRIEYKSTSTVGLQVITHEYQATDPFAQWRHHLQHILSLPSSSE